MYMAKFESAIWPFFSLKIHTNKHNLKSFILHQIYNNNKNRKQFGRLLAQNQLIQKKYADMIEGMYRD